MINKEIYQHFRSDEHQFIEKVEDIVARVEERYTFSLTEFLNPRQIKILESVVANRGLKYYISSNYYPTEYAKVLIAPDYYDFNVDDFELSLLEINYNAKFNQLTHSQIMGALINKLGIKRSTLGDILVEDGYAQILLDKNMVDYCINHISKIGRAGVSFKEVEFTKLIKPKQEKQQADIIVSSMRLDKLLSAALKLSRKQAGQLIEAEKVKVNYQIFNKSSENLQIEDLVSVRGFGRFSLVKDNGLTKNGKRKLTIAKMIHK